MTSLYKDYNLVLILRNGKDQGKMKLKIATWNITCAQPKYKATFDDAWNYYLNDGEINADIYFFQEGVKPKVTKGTVIWHEISETRKWGSGIYSKKHEISEEIIPVCNPDFKGSCVLANLMINEVTTLTLISLYGLFDSNLKGYTMTNLHRIFSDLTGILDTRGRKIVLGGDLNASIQCDQQWGGNAHKLFFDRLDDFKLFNCFKPFCKDFVQTHVHSVSKIPWQNDYFFISKTISRSLKGCVVINNEQVRKYSDHNPVIITLDL